MTSTTAIEFTDRELQILRDALAAMRHTMRGRYTLEVDAEVCAVANRLRQSVSAGVAS